MILVAIFLIATVVPVHMGVLGLMAAFLVGQFIGGYDSDEVLGFFPADLFLILVGVTYLFAIARQNGTVDWLVGRAVKSVGGRVVLIPWVMFGITAILTATGCVVPAAVAIVAPVGLGFALRYRINPALMGLFIINGGSAGGFSPMSIFGTITNGVVERSGLDGSPGLLFLASLVFNILLSVVLFFIFGGRELINRRVSEEDARGAVGLGVESGAGDETPVADGQRSDAGTNAPVAGAQTLPRYGPNAGPDATVIGLNRDRVCTIIGIMILTLGSLFSDQLGLDPGFIAITVGGVLALLSPNETKNAVGQVAWPTVLLICGIVTYVGVMEGMGTVDFLGTEVATIGAPLVAALVICFIGSAISAFASTTGILGALIPLAVPFLQSGEIAVMSLVLALAISSSVVDSSPFSTSGALVVANSPESEREFVFNRLMRWGLSMIVIAPLTTWLLLILPSELF